MFVSRIAQKVAGGGWLKFSRKVRQPTIN